MGIANELLAVLQRIRPSAQAELPFAAGWAREAPALSEAAMREARVPIPFPEAAESVNPDLLADLRMKLKGSPSATFPGSGRIGEQPALPFSPGEPDRSSLYNVGLRPSIADRELPGYRFSEQELPVGVGSPGFHANQLEETPAIEGGWRRAGPEFFRSIPEQRPLEVIGRDQQLAGIEALGLEGLSPEATEEISSILNILRGRVSDPLDPSFQAKDYDEILGAFNNSIRQANGAVNPADLEQRVLHQFRLISDMYKPSWESSIQVNDPIHEYEPFLTNRAPKGAGYDGPSEGSAPLLGGVEKESDLMGRYNTREAGFDQDVSVQQLLGDEEALYNDGTISTRPQTAEEAESELIARSKGKRNPQFKGELEGDINQYRNIPASAEREVTAVNQGLFDLIQRVKATATGSKYAEGRAEMPEVMERLQGNKKLQSYYAERGGAEGLRKSINAARSAEPASFSLTREVPLADLQKLRLRRNNRVYVWNNEKSQMEVVRVGKIWQKQNEPGIAVVQLTSPDQGPKFISKGGAPKADARVEWVGKASDFWDGIPAEVKAQMKKDRSDLLLDDQIVKRHIQQRGPVHDKGQPIVIQTKKGEWNLTLQHENIDPKTIAKAWASGVAHFQKNKNWKDPLFSKVFAWRKSDSLRYRDEGRAANAMKKVSRPADKK